MYINYVLEDGILGCIVITCVCGWIDGWMVKVQKAV